MADHTILVLSGPAGPSLYLDDYRIAGPKPWGGGTVLHEFHVSDNHRIADLAPANPVPSGNGSDRYPVTEAFDHEEDCPIWGNKGPCNCRLTLSFAPTPDPLLDVERLAFEIAKHRYSMSLRQCSCGEKYQPQNEHRHLAKVVAALASKEADRHE